MKSETSCFVPARSNCTKRGLLSTTPAAHVQISHTRPLILYSRCIPTHTTDTIFCKMRASFQKKNRNRRGFFPADISDNIFAELRKRCGELMSRRSFGAWCLTPSWTIVPFSSCGRRCTLQEKKGNELRVDNLNRLYSRNVAGRIHPPPRLDKKATRSRMCISNFYLGHDGGDYGRQR